MVTPFCRQQRVLLLFVVQQLLLSRMLTYSQATYDFRSSESSSSLRQTPGPTKTTTTVDKISKNNRLSNTAAATTTVRVFVLVGQSNMVGHGACSTTDKEGNPRNGTLEWLVRNVPDQYGKLTTNKTWTERPDVWIANNREKFDDPSPNLIRQFGRLTACGYGGDPGQAEQMGPEVGFGWAVGDHFHPNGGADTNVENEDNQDQVLLLKIAWGGKSLAVDFLPPTSAMAQGVGVGPYYHSMITTVLYTLAHLETYLPPPSSSSARTNVQLSGFAWHQGWNDGCDTSMTHQYESHLANLIRDIRNDWNMPNLPVSIGVSGMVGYPNDSENREDNDLRQEVIRAQFAVANATRYPEFQGTVTAVETRDFARLPAPHSPSNNNYHWMNNCESYWLVGQAMGKAMIQMIQTQEEKSKKKRKEKVGDNGAEYLSIS